MRGRRMKPEEIAPDIRRMMRDGMSPESRKRINRMVIGPVMVTMALVSFLTEKGPDDKPWKSKAKETQLGGRWSAKYKKRASGTPITADKIRNTEGGDLANAHTVIEANAAKVKVGPGVRGKQGRARVIMDREASYGNYAVGWDANRQKVIRAELAAFHREIAEGRKPRYLPRSRIVRKV